MPPPPRPVRPRQDSPHLSQEELRGAQGEVRGEEGCGDGGLAEGDPGGHQQPRPAAGGERHRGGETGAGGAQADRRRQQEDAQPQQQGQGIG